MEKSLRGSLLVVKTRFADGCVCTWSLQPTFSRMGQATCYFLQQFCSQATHRRVHDLADHLHMPIVGETVFQHSQKYLFPVVSEMWLSMQIAIFNGLNTVDRIVMSGDGRCDSPRHCAKYMTYTIMEEEMGYVVHFLCPTYQRPTYQKFKCHGTNRPLQILRFLKRGWYPNCNPYN